ncbi:FeoA family protein [Capnocytophaga stomatis]|uniref:Ferrous iron transport protein A n=1 Tax=Capnocytophaga stomatis TaxID=1848904 RepID=A0A250FWU3_9FLAO|nr:FeoA family protein [Capnocytophaga stomatis]ATA89629.1 ferrous iron transport protein A [Capnocytophaga stomatis]GIJ92861.1 iron transporter [Capnocytophaga stomatis]GIJ97323.1 iron transporter [Capnocytophaga stomatis]GIM50129.1 iron transporter [Capnocytophaga stomatis]
MEKTSAKGKLTVSHLKKGEKGIIKHIDIENVPLKLIELGCFVGSEVEVIEKSVFGDPIYVNMNNSYLSIRKEMASLIEIEKI